MAKRTEISELGEFGLIDALTRGVVAVNPSTVRGVGDDAAVIDCSVAGSGGAGGWGGGGGAEGASGSGGVGSSEGRYTLLSTDLLLEGVNFDLVYFPLKHLGYKAVVVGISDILAMNGHPRQLTFSVGVSAKLSVEDLQQLYDGVRAACVEYGVDLVGGDTSASVNGLVISVSVLGEVERERIVYRGGARLNDLICITGDLGAAYMGLHLLEREKRALGGGPAPPPTTASQSRPEAPQSGAEAPQQPGGPAARQSNAAASDPRAASPTHSALQPHFEGYNYLLERQLHPHARLDVIDSLREADLVPTSMIDLSDGLASDLLHICKSSGVGARIYLDRIPIAKETYSLAEEMNADPVVAALNGGDDHQLLFTVPLAAQQAVMRMGGIDIIGHITPATTGVMLTTPDGSDIPITAPGHK